MVATSLVCRWGPGPTFTQRGVRSLVRRDRRKLFYRALGDGANQVVFVGGTPGRDPTLLQKEGEISENALVRVGRHGEVDFDLEVVVRVLGADDRRQKKALH